MPAEQRSLGRGNPALLGAGDRVSRHEAGLHALAEVLRAAHHIAFGTADVGEHGIAKVEGGERLEQAFHGQDGHRQLDDVRLPAGLLQGFGATIDDT